MTDTTTPSVEQQLRIEARPELVWEFWTEPARLGEWWGTATATVAEIGGAFVVEMENGYVMRGEYLALDAPHRLAFTFGWDGDELGAVVPAGSTRVEVILDPDGDATILTLRHFDLPEVTSGDHGDGWDRQLAVLVTAVAGAA
jgi:uncharacterized protein YndB with AHSA1/START domain